MTNNPIIAEVRKARKAYAARFNNDMAAMVADLRERQARGGRKVVRYPPRRIESSPETPEAESSN